jgi:thiol-disulfide isomerase/thioredoxin
METLPGTVEHAQSNGQSALQRCPKCGATMEKDPLTMLGGGTDPRALATGATTCPKCGAESEQPDVYQGKDNIAALPPTGGPRRNLLVPVVVAFVVALMLYFGFHMAHRSASHASLAPDFALESLDGKTMRLSDLRGKAVLLNFWATWCGPCKIEMPWFVDLQKQYGSQGLQIVGVAMDDASKEDIAAFAKDMGVNYPILIGKESVGDQYGGVPALPESFFISRDGRIVDKIVGLIGKAEIEDAVKKALETRPAPSRASTSENTAASQPQR